MDWSIGFWFINRNDWLIDLAKRIDNLKNKTYNVGTDTLAIFG